MSAAFLLDTNVCIDLIRGQSPTPGSVGAHVSLDATVVSVVTVAELEVGVVKAASTSSPRQLLDGFLEQVVVVDFDMAAARHYGQIRAHLERKGKTIGPLDLLIAAHARSRGARLVTANLDEFRRVPGLECVGWKRAVPGKSR
jgi:tRNA(fMet)-specific endonuclease VapC